ncbi:hypothetical protein EDM02_02425 [Candidatus Cardinium hertigii]|uniref:Uncharacterized protein n=1 Tax=Candidatus Cardinium hertigii TaxID=247481 RepID=A0A3N2QCI7_9BACT|nr:hypothetical protein EDM02_02425 [Candidatus Cardinium hertigii]
MGTSCLYYEAQILEFIKIMEPLLNHCTDVNIARSRCNRKLQRLCYKAVVIENKNFIKERNLYPNVSLKKNINYTILAL